MKKTITVFGSSLPVEGEEEFESAYRLGSLLAQKGFKVCTGGYQGIMNAVSKGAYENNGETIGVMVDFWNSTPSKYLTKKIECDTLFERIEKLMQLGDAYVILQGGTGTLLELAAVWEFMNKDLLSLKPAACHSSMWNEITMVMDKQMLKENRKAGMIKPFDTIEKIVEFLSHELNGK